MTTPAQTTPGPDASPGTQPTQEGTYQPPGGATAWLEHDDDPTTRAALHHLLSSASAGNRNAQEELTEAFRGPLAFGTAGIRAPMGPGPQRINRTTITQTAAGIASYLTAQHTRPRAVIGYDGRHHSREYAHDIAAVLSGAGVHVSLLPGPLPTPVLAFTTRHRSAHAGLMVTASHNPKTDNGVKVYLADGHQIVPPVDADITEHIARHPAHTPVTRSTQYETLTEEDVDAYISTVTAVTRPDSPRHVTSVHTALHGVSSSTFHTAATRAGFPTPIPVLSQAAPHPDFPTVASPNPEHLPTLREAIDTAKRYSADVVIAHDPDGDRLALALPVPQHHDTQGTSRTPGDWTALTGDEIGWLLAWWLLNRGSFTGTMAASLVSSPLLSKIAAAAGVPFRTTHTGFKWIARAPDLGFGYEEAIGYCVDPRNVGDKDGISAGVLALEAIATLKSRGISAFDILDDLARQHGVHLSSHTHVSLPSTEHARRVVEATTTQPPTTIGPLPVQEAINLADGYQDLPPTTGLLLVLPHARVIIRPSGTEPKVRCYLNVEHPPTTTSLGEARRTAQATLQSLTEAVDSLLKTMPEHT